VAGWGAAAPDPSARLAQAAVCYAGAMDFRRTALAELAGRVRRGEMSAREVVGHCLERIESLNPRLNAFVAVDGERAMAEAARIDERVAAGDDPGPLAGVPFGVKDLEDAAGFVTSRGSTLFADGPPAARDSALVARLKAAGAVVVGKTNTPELGWKADTDNARFGATANPWDPGHSPGGSSGGAAAALAAGMVPLATGSDGGGSIRIPASCCGLTGFKPSLGRVPSGGPEPPDWHHLSTRAPMTRRLVDAVHVLDAVVGPDPTDLRSLPRAEAPWPAAGFEPRLPAKVGWSPTLGYAEPDAEVRGLCQAAVEELAALGTEVVELDTVFDHDPVDQWLTLTSVYNARTLAPYRRTDRWGEVDPLLAATVEAAEQTDPLELVRAEDACHRLNYRLVELFHQVRILLTPTCAGLPPSRSISPMGMVNGREDPNWVRYTYPFNMTRSPAASVCVGLSAGGLPVGLQVVGPQHADLAVIRSAAAVEEMVGFDQLAPMG
jgi:aspartyl-tRNA(Asn)/glutamyl-tRNA(Gln) amidotransferase subunit A